MYTAFRLRTLVFKSNKFYHSIQCSTTVLKHQPIESIIIKRAFSKNCNVVYSLEPTKSRNFRPLTTGLKKVEQFILPDIGEGINEVVIKDWLVKTGDFVKEFDGICDVESDKATATISSRFEGIVTKVYYEVGQMAKVGKPLVDIQVDSGVEQEEAQKEDESQPVRELGTVNAPTDLPSTIRTLPSVRRFARENDIDLGKVKATGKYSHILKEDLLTYLGESRRTNLEASSPQKRPQLGEPHQAVADKPVLSATTKQFSGIQKAMFKTMTRSLKIPHFSLKNDIDMTILVASSKGRNAGKKTEDKVSNLSFIVKIVSLALKKFPQLNASINDDDTGLVIKPYHNIGIAVDTPSGLLVPNIKNVQNLSILEINSELLRLRHLAYVNKLGPADLGGGTITLSNIGAIGGLVGIPVIVPPEILIGALGEIRKLPRFNEDNQLEARHILELTWSADHRVVDGATLSRFTNLIKQHLENLDSALLELR